jgi:hypothetical protein
MQSLLRQPFGLFLLVIMISGIELFVWFYLWQGGQVELLLASDRSHLSAIILVIYALTTGYFVWVSYQVSRQFNSLPGSQEGYSVMPLVQRFFDQLPQDRAPDRCSALLEVLDTRVRSAYAFGFIIADLMLKLGILGTVIGFIFMLGSLSNLNSVDITVMQTLLVEMSSGMKVALFTTLSGLLAGIALNIKFNLLDWSVDHLLNDIREISLGSVDRE